MPQANEVQDQDENDQQAEGEIVAQTPDTVVEEGEGEAVVVPPIEEKAPPEKPKERPVYTMPVTKAQEEKHRAVEKARAEARAEADAEIARLKVEYENKSREISSPTLQNDFEQVASKHGLDVEAVKDLFTTYQKSLPDFSKYEQLIKDKEVENHKILVEREFDEKVAPLLVKDYPQATSEHIRSVKERIAELAFTKDFNTYRLEDIYKVNKDDFEFKNSISAESSSGRASEFVDFTKMTDEEEIELADRDPVAYRKYVKWSVANDSKFMD